MYFKLDVVNVMIINYFLNRTMKTEQRKADPMQSNVNMAGPSIHVKVSATML